MRLIIVVLQAFLTAYAFIMNNVNSIKLAGNSNRFLFPYIFILFMILYYCVQAKYNKLIYWVSAAFLAGIQVVSFSYSVNNNLLFILEDNLHIVKSILCFSGFLFLFNWGCNLIEKSIEYLEYTGGEWSLKYHIIIGILGLFWLPHVILSYPASFTPDSAWQCLQGMGDEVMSNHNPVFHSFIMGLYIKIGLFLFHSGNVGIFLFIVTQYIFALLVFSYSLLILHKKNINKILFYFIFIIYAFCPLITGYLGVVIKDVPYAIAFLLMIICGVKLYDNKYKAMDYQTIIMFLISGTIMILHRNEGRYVFLTSVIILCIVYLKNGMDKMKWIRAVVVLCVPLIIAMGIINVIMIRYDGVPGSDREKLSFFLQQTARVVSIHGNKLPDDEKLVIDKTLLWDTLAERYNPMISDPVKNYYNENLTKEELAQYFIVWGKEFIRYPFTCIQATLNQNYLMFSIYSDDRIYYNSAEVDFWGTFPKGLKNLPIIEQAQNKIILTYKCMHDLPIISWFCDRSFYCIILVMLTAVILVMKKGLLPIFIPLWISVFVVILGPTVMGHPRYLFTVVYSLPFLFGVSTATNTTLH